MAANPRNKSDHDILIQLSTTVGHMQSDISEIKERIESRDYPCKWVHEHSRRLNKIENERKLIYGVIATFIPLLFAIVILLIQMFFDGG